MAFDNGYVVLYVLTCAPKVKGEVLKDLRSMATEPDQLMTKAVENEMQADKKAIRKPYTKILLEHFLLAVTDKGGRVSTESPLESCAYSIIVENVSSLFTSVPIDQFRPSTTTRSVLNIPSALPSSC